MSNAFRVLHVFPSFEVGGAQRRVINLINAKTGNFTHSVFAMDGCYEALALIDGVEDAPQMPKGLEKMGLIQSVKACRKLLKEYNPDLLVTYNWGSVEWVLANKYLRHCPMIQVQDGFGTEEQTRQIRRRKLIRSFAYKSCDAVIVPSRSLEHIARKSWGIKKSRLHYVPNGIDVRRFICPPDRTLMKELGLEAGDRIIGTVAALRPEKNLGRLIEAFSNIAPLHQDIKLVIVGGGMAEAALKMLSERIGLKDRVIFTGPLAEPERIIPAFDIFAMSSDTEQMPLSLMEAMACGLPIVSTDVGDIKGMVSEENQKYIEGKSAKGLTRSLSALLDTRDIGRHMGAMNQQKAKSEFTLTRMIERYETLFWEAIRDFQM